MSLAELIRVTTGQPPTVHERVAPAVLQRPEDRGHDMTLAPRVLAFCSTPRVRGDLVREFGEKGPETCKNLVRRGAVVNLGPGADGCNRFVRAERAGEHQAAPRQPGVKASLVSALRAARAHVTDAAVLQQIDDALARA